MTTISLKQFQRLLEDKLPADLEAAALRGLRSAALRGKGFVVEEISYAEPHSAVDTGGLRNSVAVTLMPWGALLSVDAPHAAPINFGTRPYWPQQAPLALWALRKGLAADEEEAEEVAFFVALKISREGIKPRHFFDKAMKRVEDIVESEIHEELRRL